MKPADLQYHPPDMYLFDSATAPFSLFSLPLWSTSPNTGQYCNCLCCSISIESSPVSICFICYSLVRSGSRHIAACPIKNCTFGSANMVPLFYPRSPRSPPPSCAYAHTDKTTTATNHLWIKTPRPRDITSDRNDRAPQSQKKLVEHWTSLCPARFPNQERKVYLPPCEGASGGLLGFAPLASA